MHQGVIEGVSARHAASTSSDQLLGYGVESLDGSFGKIDDRTLEVGSGTLIVVDTGFWHFGALVMLPVAAIESVEHNSKKVFVNLTKDEIKAAPEFDESLPAEQSYEERLATYYGPGGASSRHWK